MMVTDNFNRADENPLSNNGMWVAASNADGALKVVSNVCRMDGVDEKNRPYYIDGTFDDDQYAKVKFIYDSGHNNDVSICVRMGSSGDGYGVNLFYKNSVWDCGLFKQVGVNWDRIGTWNHAAIAPTDIVEIRCVGTTISWYINGTLQDSVTDSSLSSGAPGLDAWRIYGAFDDFECGDYPPPSTAGFIQCIFIM